MTPPWLPPYEEGLLPYFLLYSTLATLTHSLATYLRPLPSIQAFTGPNAPARSPLLAHVYGLANLLAAGIRGAAAYHIHVAPVYDLALLSFGAVLGFYVAEVGVWRTVRVREGVVPVVAAGVGVVWMEWARGGYVSLS
ncbi:uncharacterized protein BO72DRAFT_492380 [Aspergillus fijiensis CBS 313.89]|uniref:Ergosterol biosynthesis protein Erg28 n=1 Tax=Aspergillus fijiensis CBS 313.89 TaxID=1448319 RepID=A0A8G1RYI0_9EURO|nr:uncharacterized protein BO72DRAFT_492380 [Aspergillus fijiensis CBS 313.89]RAK81549.1 hypothetical protein BO72DRAFT_492380 [Aspergillus fijiensis CBS 313.89]